MSDEPKQNQIIGDSFASWLNQQWGTDYKAEANLNEDKVDEEVDTYLISSTNQYQKLYLQLTTQEGIIRKISRRLRRRAEKEKLDMVQGPIIDFNILNYVQSAFLKKNSNKYSPEVQQKLILIIWGDLGPLLNASYAKERFQSLSQSKFHAIYQVQLPTDSTISSHPHNGQIVPIKPLLDPRA